MTDREAPSTTGEIAQATALGKRLGVSGTPTFFLQRGNGPQKPLDYSDYTPGSFTPSIDAALAG